MKNTMTACLFPDESWSDKETRYCLTFLESLYLWESLEDKENNPVQILDTDSSSSGEMEREMEGEDMRQKTLFGSGFGPDEKNLMRSLHRSSSHSHLYLILLLSSSHQRLDIELQDLWWLLAEVKQTDAD